MGNGRTPSDDDDEVTDPSIRTPELDEVLPSSVRPPPLPSARVARELPPLRPPLSGRPPPLPLARPTTPSRPPPPPSALLRPTPGAPRSPTMPPPRPPADTASAIARPSAIPPPRVPSIPPPRLPSPPASSAQPTRPVSSVQPTPLVSSMQPTPRAAPSAPPRAVPSAPPHAVPSAPPRLNEALSYTARRPSDAPPIAATFDVGRLAQLQRELDETQGRASKLLAELSALRPAMLELETARKRIAELEARVAELSTPEPRDDLRRIKGIGPKFEQALRDAGVCTFAQIASWTDVDIAEIAPKIGARVDRIERDEWVGKARALLAGP